MPIRYKLLTIFLILSLFAPTIFPAIPRVPTVTASPQHLAVATKPRVQEALGAAGEGVSTSAPDLGVEKYTSNWFGNPGFELWTNPYTPTRYWYPWFSGNSYTWYAQAPRPVKQGSYSAGLEVRNPTYGYAQSAYWLQSTSTASAMRANDVNVTFYWYMDQNPDPAINRDFFKFYTRFYTSSTYRYLHYYLNGTTGLANSSTNAYFLIDEPSQQWNLFSRNITADYEAISTFPSLAPDAVCNYARFNTETDGYTDQYLRAYFDDFYLKNTTYTWIGGSTYNGNIEATTSWSRSSDSEAGFVRQSSSVHTGRYCASMRAQSTGNESYAALEAYPTTRASVQNQVNLSFWKSLSYGGPGTPSDWVSYLYIDFYNDTGGQQDNYQIYYVLGYGMTDIPFSNTSNQVVYMDKYPSSTGGWGYFNRNVWADLTLYFNITEAWFSYFGFWTWTIEAGSSVTLKIDATYLEAATVNGGDFEDQLDVGDPAHVFGYPYSESNLFTVTGTSYSGSKAVNLTVASNLDYSEYMYIGDRLLDGSREICLDIAWYLDDYTSSSGNYAYLRLSLLNRTNDANYYMYYCFAVQDDTFGSNTSTNAYFNVTGANTLDTWNLMHRDLVHDFEDVFGFIPNVYIYRVQLDAYTATGDTIVSLLLDDFYLYDDPIPTFINIQHSPDSPDHNEPVLVTANVVDPDLDTVMLHYRLDGGGWSEVEMTDTASYEATIPGQPYDTLVEYYITANDTGRWTTTADNGGSYYKYTVADSTAPVLSGVNHLPAAPTYLEKVWVKVTAVDDESGIAYIRLYYRKDGGSWEAPIIMTPAAGNIYKGAIRNWVWNTLVEYYLDAMNDAGAHTIMNNGGAYYNYTVSDNDNPLVSINTPTDDTTVSGLVIVIAIVSDLGSGINRVEFLITSASVSVNGTDTTAPYYLFSWNTSAVANGENTITVTAFDDAGNSATDIITVTVNNPVPTTPPPIPQLLIGGIAVLAIILVVLMVPLLWFFMFRKPR